VVALDGSWEHERLCRERAARPAPPDQRTRERDISTEASSGRVDLRDYVDVVRRRKWTVAVCTIVGLVLAAAYLAARSVQYTSTATVLVKPLTSNPQSSVPLTSLVSMDTEAALVSTTDVAATAGETLGWEGSDRQLLNHVAVSNPSNTLVLDISFTGSSPVVARRGAQAFAHGYLALRDQEARRLATVARAKLEGQIASLQSRVADIDERLAGLRVGSSEYQALNSSKSPLETQINLLESQLANQGSPPDAGDLVSSAQVPTAPSSPGPVLVLVLGAMVGLFVGLVATFLQDRRDDRPRGRTDVEDVLGAPVLGIIPAAQSRMIVPLAPQARSRQPVTMVSSYHALAAAIARSAEVLRIQTLMFVPPRQGTDVALLVANLGQILARDEKQVLAMSAVPNGHGLNEAFDLANRRGLSQVLSGSMPMEKATYPLKRSKLRVLTSGPPRDGKMDLYRPETIRAALDEATSLADIVLIEGEPLLATDRGIGLAPLVDGVVLVIDTATTTRTRLVDVRWKLERIGVNIVGSVLLNLDPDAASRYDARALGETTPQPPSPLAPPPPEDQDRRSSRTAPVRSVRPAPE
jgi:capsular polysaccharide biosynthesis protein/Mrp family chromosome partitioning ATPase